MSDVPADFQIHASQVDPCETRAVELMTAWVASIADRVRNPIAAISGAMQVFERLLAQNNKANRPNSEVEAIQDVVGQIHTRLDHLESYVNDLILFAQPVATEPSWCDLNKVVSKVVADSEKSFAGHLAVTTDLQTSRLFVDAEQLEIVLSHLLRNAAEASRERIAKVHIAAKADVSAVTVAVTDNGPGFHREYASRIGQPFFSTKTAGTGLGLAISRRYVEAMGGQFTLASRKSGSGARIQFTIPIPSQTPPDIHRNAK